MKTSELIRNKSFRLIVTWKQILFFNDLIFGWKVCARLVLIKYRGIYSNLSFFAGILYTLYLFSNIWGISRLLLIVLFHGCRQFVNFAIFTKTFWHLQFPCMKSNKDCTSFAHRTIWTIFICAHFSKYVNCLCLFPTEINLDITFQGFIR